MLFGPPHVVSLVLVGVLSIGLFKFGKQIPALKGKRFRFGFVTLMVTNELLWHYWALSTGAYTPQRMLPLHLCTAMVWITVGGLLTRDRRLYPAMYFLGVAGAIQALITPDAGYFGFPHFRFFQTMISHAGVFLAGLYVVAVEGYRPTQRAMWNTFLGLNVYALIVWIINELLASNYMFVSAKPDTLSLLDVLPDWPWYIAVLEGMALVSFLALWWPFRRREAPRSSASQ